MNEPHLKVFDSLVQRIVVVWESKLERLVELHRTWGVQVDIPLPFPGFHWQSITVAGVGMPQGCLVQMRSKGAFFTDSDGWRRLMNLVIALQVVPINLLTKWARMVRATKQLWGLFILGRYYRLLLRDLKRNPWDQVSILSIRNCHFWIPCWISVGVTPFLLVPSFPSPSLNSTQLIGRWQETREFHSVSLWRQLADASVAAGDWEMATQALEGRRTDAKQFFPGKDVDDFFFIFHIIPRFPTKVYLCVLL